MPRMSGTRVVAEFEHQRVALISDLCRWVESVPEGIQRWKAVDSRSTIPARLVAAESTCRPALDSFRRWASCVPCAGGLRHAPGARRDRCGSSTGERKRYHTSLFTAYPSASCADACQCRRAFRGRSRFDAGAAAHTPGRPSVPDREPGGRLARPSGSDALLAGWSGPHSRGLFGHDLGSRPRVGHRATRIGCRATHNREFQTDIKSPNKPPGASRRHARWERSKGFGMGAAAQAERWMKLSKRAPGWVSCRRNCRL